MVTKKSPDKIKVVDGIRYFPAKSGVMMRDQIIKILCESDVPRTSYGYERMLKCLGTGLRTYKRKFKTRINEQTLHVSEWFKSAIAIHESKAVGFVFVERDELFIWVDEQYRRRGIGRELIKTLMDKYPKEFEYHLVRPWVLKDYKRIKLDTQLEAAFYGFLSKEGIMF